MVPNDVEFMPMLMAKYSRNRRQIEMVDAFILEVFGHFLQVAKAT